MKYAAYAVALFALAACNSDRTTAPISDAMPLADRSGAGADFDDATPGVVYTLSNQASGNAVLVFRRRADGSLTADGSVASGGNGSGAGLGSQNALTFSRDGELLFAVNAGSNSVSAFRVDDGRLTLVSTAPSGGTHPISATAANGILYVLNDGGTGNISGLRYTNNGRLIPIAGSARALSSTSAAPAQIEFSARGDRLIVTEKGTNMIDTYDVAANGLASAGRFQPSVGRTPFGFAISDNTLIVSEAFGGAPDASAASSYTVGRSGPVSVVSASVPTTETAACWVAVLRNGKFAYTANTGSGTITGYRVRNDGELSLLDANGETAVFGAGTAPADLALSTNNRFLYVRNGGNRTIGATRVNANGSLTVLPGVSGLPAGTVGLAAR